MTDISKCFVETKSGTLELMLGSALNKVKPKPQQTALSTLKRKAKKLGLTIDIEFNKYGNNYWINGGDSRIYEGDRFCFDKLELENKLSDWK